ncbi:MAG: hypothetical protein QXJ56_04610 [Ignisphaera sp.]
MEHLIKMFLAGENCSDLYSALLNDSILADFIRVCRNASCRNALEFFLQKDSESMASIITVDSYLRLSPLALIISIHFGNPYINRFAYRFSKLYVDYYLASLSEVEFIKIIRGLGLEVEKSDGCFSEADLYINRNNAIVRICYRYRIPFTSYLKAVRSLSSTEVVWSLSMMLLQRGFVLIENREKVARIAMEYLRNLISNRIRSIHTSCSDSKLLLQKFVDKLYSFDQNLANDIRDFVKLLESETLQISNSISTSKEKTLEMKINLSEALKDAKSLLLFSENFFPPCMQVILRSLTSGENLTHHQRFALATFLINLDIDISELLQIFRSSPDFNERITRYQLEHLAGLRGSKRRYLPYSCSTMKTLNMCNSECGVKNPLQYTYHKLGLRPFPH